MTIKKVCESIGLGALSIKLGNHTGSYLCRRVPNVSVVTDETLAEVALSFLDDEGGLEHFGANSLSGLKWTNVDDKDGLKEAITEILKLQRKHKIETLHRKPGPCPGCISHPKKDTPKTPQQSISAQSDDPDILEALESLSPIASDDGPQSETSYVTAYEYRIMPIESVQMDNPSDRLSRDRCLLYGGVWYEFPSIVAKMETLEYLVKQYEVSHEKYRQLYLFAEPNSDERFRCDCIRQHGMEMQESEERYLDDHAELLGGD